MNTELSLFERHRIALSFQGPISEDPKINSIANIQRLVAQFVQGLLLGGVVGCAGWIYNDPDRKNGESLPWTLYAVGGVSVTALGSVTVYRIHRWCRNKKKHESWIVDPIYAAAMASVAPLVAQAIAYEEAKKIANAISELNIKNGELANEQVTQLRAQQDDCAQQVFARREAFTLPSCFVCVTSDNQSSYQALPVEEFPALLCGANIGNLQSFSIDSLPGEWPCMKNVFFNHSDPDYRWKSYVSDVLHIKPPMQVKVLSPHNDTCLYVNASGTKVDFLGRDLCYRPDDFDPSQQRICATTDWNAFAMNFSANANWVNPTYTHLDLSYQVSELLYGDSTKTQWSVFGPALLLSMLALITKMFVKNCKKSNPTPPVEMETLTAEEEL